MKHIVCYSGGHSSALVAVEVVQKYGKDNVILLNHDISSQVEHSDIKRFKNEVADYLGLDVTYANADDFEEMPPLAVAEKMNGIQFQVGNALCTYHLKTLPFYKWLEENHPCGANDCIIYYGFDDVEENRIYRRTTNMRAMGYMTDYPLAYWSRNITAIEDIGIKRPTTYKIYRHANCQGCLKAGRQHWYATYCLRRDLFNQAKQVESKVKHSIIKGVTMSEMEPMYYDMLVNKGVCPDDKTESNAFWAMVEKILPEQLSMLPCDCAF